MEPIKINVKDNFKHTQIAFLVDREDFMKEVIKLREYFNKRSNKKLLPFVPTSFDKWFTTLQDWGGTKDHFLKGSPMARERSLNASKLLAEGKKKEAKFEIKILNLLLNQWKHFSFELHIEKLLKKYKLPSTCFRALAKIVTCNQVDDLDWSYCKITLEPSGIKSEEITPSRIADEPNCFIKISPYLSKAELSKEFEANLKDIINLYKKSPYGYKTYKKDTISNIKRDRSWYWTNKKGQSYGKIRRSLPENEQGTSDDFIAKAIQQYKRNLQT